MRKLSLDDAIKGASHALCMPGMKHGVYYAADEEEVIELASVADVYIYVRSQAESAAPAISHQPYATGVHHSNVNLVRMWMELDQGAICDLLADSLPETPSVCALVTILKFGHRRNLICTCDGVDGDGFGRVGVHVGYMRVVMRSMTLFGWTGSPGIAEFEDVDRRGCGCSDVTLSVYMCRLVHQGRMPMHANAFTHLRKPPKPLSMDYYFTLDVRGKVVACASLGDVPHHSNRNVTVRSFDGILDERGCLKSGVLSTAHSPNDPVRVFLAYATFRARETQLRRSSLKHTFDSNCTEFNVRLPVCIDNATDRM